MEKHFNNSLLQLTFAVNQDCTSESITPKHSRSIRINSICFHGTQWDGHKETNARLTESWLWGCLPKQAAPGSPAPVELGAPKGAQNFVLSVFPTGQEGITNYFRSLYHTLYLEIISLYFFLS